MLFLRGIDLPEDVEAIRNQALTDLMSGRVSVWTNESTSVSKLWGKSPEYIIEECNRFLVRRVTKTVQTY